jgi:hypothetical protein
MKPRGAVTRIPAFGMKTEGDEALRRDADSPSGDEGQQLSIPTHTVQFYEDDSFLIDSVATFVKEGIEAQDTVVMFLTPQHRQLLDQALRADDAGPGLREHAGSLAFYDAEDTMAEFMVEGWPEESLFMPMMDRILRPLSEGRPVRVFGEMVALLWTQGQFRAALRLEELWNALIARQPFSLLCAYGITGFQGKEARESYRRVCAQHNHVHSQDKAA